MSGGHNPVYAARLEETPREIKKREERNKARYDLERAGVAHKGDHRDVDHRVPLTEGGSNAPSNWRMRSVHANRGYNRDAHNKPIP